jgi:hypothetical protein
VSAQLEVIVYGLSIMQQTLDPCKMQLSGLCPVTTSPLYINFPVTVSPSVVSQIPGIAYNVPDLDVQVKISINSTTGDRSMMACAQASLSNGKTVHQTAVEWTVGVIAGLGLTAGAIASDLGHWNRAAHLAAYTLSLLGRFQAQAMVGATAVSMPPIVEAWTQNFQWSMGIIHIDFLQTVATWYQRATGGTASTVLSSLSMQSVQVQKRSMDPSVASAGQSVTNHLSKRAATTSTACGLSHQYRINKSFFNGGDDPPESGCHYCALFNSLQNRH